MFRVIAAGMAIAWALAGWRNMPRLSHASAGAAGMSIGGCILLAYWLGRRTSKQAAIAVATATAEAHAVAAVTGSGNSAASINLYLGGAELGRHRAHYAEATGLDRAPWLEGAHARPELDDSDALEVALADVLEPETE